MSTSNYRLLPIGLVHSFRPLIIFSTLFSLLSVSPTQIFSQSSACDFSFPIADEPTLCETYPNFSPNIVLGSNIMYASQLSGDLTGNISIVGDFIIDRTFKFYNAVIKISPGKKIKVQPQYTIAEEGFSDPYNKRIVFTIDNCDLFACNGLWKGIVMTNKTDIITKSGTHIEDAEKAIDVTNTSAVTLTVYDTWFNRNVIGINLSNSIFYNHDPVFRRFFGNDFTCNSPISGTSSDVSEAGMNLNNVDIKLGAPIGLATFTSTFRDQIHGIKVIGSSSNLRANSLDFILCKKAGIYLDNLANLDLESSTFTEIFEKGIHVKSGKNIRVWNCDFHLEYFGFPSIEPNSVCAYLESFPIGGNVSITESEFLTNNILPWTKHAKGIVVSGSQIGGDLNFNVSKCLFNFTANQLDGIELDGTFPRAFVSNIENNDFVYYNEEASNRWMTGINCINGDKYNVHIVGNRFEGTNSFSEFVDCIRLNGSTGGFGNEVSDNKFNENFDNVLEVSNGVWAVRFVNAKICGNKDYFGTWSMSQFQSMNYNTRMQANDIYAGTDAVWFPASKTEMGIQYHNGNRFIPLWISFQPNEFHLFHPELDFGGSNDPILSLFTVHEPVSYFDMSTEEYDPLSLYHPISVKPNHNAWMQVDLDGTPISTCVTQSPPQIVDSLDILIAKNLMGPVIPDSIDQWGGQWYLYGRLDRETAYLNMSDDFGDFFETNENSTLGKLYDVEQSIQGALTKSGSSKLIEYSLLNRKLTFEHARDSIADLSTWTEQDRLNMNVQCDSLFDVKQGLSSLDDDLLGSKNELLDSALTLYNVISSNSLDYVDYHRRLLGYRIDLLRNGYSGISQSEIEDIIDLAIRCPSDIGIAIYGLRGLLPECEKVTLTDYFLSCDSFFIHEMPVPIAESEQGPSPYAGFSSPESLIPLQNIHKAEKNDENDLHTISHTEIRGIDGKFIYSWNWEDTPLSFNSWLESRLDLPPGFYVVTTIYHDNHVESKLHVKL